MSRRMTDEQVREVDARFGHLFGSYYDRLGQPISIGRWMQLHGDMEYCQILLDEFADDVAVSTVWLGLDHNWGSSPPLIFETMVWRGDVGDYTRRYSTEQEAREGHARILEEERLGACLTDDSLSPPSPTQSGSTSSDDPEDQSH